MAKRRNGSPHEEAEEVKTEEVQVVQDAASDQATMEQLLVEQQNERIKSLEKRLDALTGGAYEPAKSLRDLQAWEKQLQKMERRGKSQKFFITRPHKTQKKDKDGNPKIINDVWIERWADSLEEAEKSMNLEWRGDGPNPYRVVPASALEPEAVH